MSQKHYAEPGTIDDARIERPMRHPYIRVEFDSGTQALPPVALNDTTEPVFIEMLCTTFGIASLSELVGKPCRALRCWPHFLETIEGLESVETGRRFTLTAFRSRCVPGVDWSPLTERRKETADRIAVLEKSLEDARKSLENVARNYRDWSKT